MNAVSLGIYPELGTAKMVTISVVKGADPAYNPTVVSQNFEGGTWVTKASADWIKDATVWTADEEGNANRAEAGGADWAVQFKVLLAKVPMNPATTRFKFSIGMQSQKIVGDDDLTVPGQKNDYLGEVTVPGYPAVWPRAETTYAPNSMLQANPEKWLLYGTDPADLTSSPAWSAGKAMNSPCTKGIAVTGIGTGSSDSITIDANPSAVNTWWATLASEGAPLVSNTVQARFRVANFGAQPHYLAPWSDVVPGSSTAPAPAPVNRVGSYDSATDRIQFKCAANSAAPVSKVCGFTKPTEPGQCVVVELTPRPGNANLAISTPYTYRNMNFIGLSKKDVPAEISIKGLQARFGGIARDRPVIITTITRNMPAWGNLPIVLDTYLMNLVKTALLGISQLFNPFDRSLAAKDVMRIAWPTYEAHVYFDTGWQRTFKGKKYRVAHPLNSYGTYFSHEGVFFGYSHGFGRTEVDSSFKEVHPGVFRMMLKNETSKKVQVGVTTQDAPILFQNAADAVCELFPYVCLNRR